MMMAVVTETVAVAPQAVYLNEEKVILHLGLMACGISTQARAAI
jgi:hypothetical protein